MISANAAQKDMATLSQFAGVFQSIVQLVPSIIESVASLVPPGTQLSAIATEVETFVKAAIAAEGHAIPVLETVWNEAKPLLAAVFAISGNAAAAAIINALPNAPTPTAT